MRYETKKYTTFERVRQEYKKNGVTPEQCEKFLLSKGAHENDAKAITDFIFNGKGESLIHKDINIQYRGNG